MKRMRALIVGGAALVVAVVLLVGSMESVIDPGFSLREHHNPRATVCWQITNTRDEPLTIHRVLFNAEWEPRIAERRGDGDDENWFPSRQLLPRTLTIGEWCLLFWRSRDVDESYEKEVIYIDLYTDRGNFRYRPRPFQEWRAARLQVNPPFEALAD